MISIEYDLRDQLGEHGGLVARAGPDLEHACARARGRAGRSTARRCTAARSSGRCRSAAAGSRTPARIIVRRRRTDAARRAASPPSRAPRTADDRSRARFRGPSSRSLRPCDREAARCHRSWPLCRGALPRTRSARPGRCGVHGSACTLAKAEKPGESHAGTGKASETLHLRRRTSVCRECEPRCYAGTYNAGHGSGPAHRAKAPPSHGRRFDAFLPEPEVERLYARIARARAAIHPSRTNDENPDIRRSFVLDPPPRARRSPWSSARPGRHARRCSRNPAADGHRRAASKRRSRRTPTAASSASTPTPTTAKQNLRHLTYVYYFNGTPKGFEGGSLRVYDDVLRNNKLARSDSLPGRPAAAQHDRVLLGARDARGRADPRAVEGVSRQPLHRQRLGESAGRSRCRDMSAQQRLRLEA